MTSTVTSKGQVTLPKAVREQLRLGTGDKLEFLIHDDGTVELLPLTSSLSELKGMVPRPEKPISLDEMDRAIQEAVFDRD